MAQREATPAFDIQVELVCEEQKLTEVVSLSLPSFPTTFDEVKEAIEKSFSVPSYLQTLWVHGVKIDNRSVGMVPSQCYLQAGDTIKVSFPMKCDCEKVKEVIKWLSECLDIIHSIQAAPSEEEVMELFSKNSGKVLHNFNIQSLIEDIFLPWSDKMKRTSAWYFHHLGGITSLVQIHKTVRSLTTDEKFKPLQRFFKYFERVCCSAFTNFAADTALRRQATEHGALDCGLSTFLGVKADDLKSDAVIEDSLMVVCNISDIPENRIYLAQKQDFIEQVLRVIGATISYSDHIARNALIVLLNMAQCKEAQQYLLQEDIIEKVLNSVSKRKVMSGLTATTDGQVKPQMKLQICYTGDFVAQMILGSPQLLRNFKISTLQKMETLLENVLKWDPSDIGKLECEQGVEWGSFAPLMYLYEPDITFNKSREVDKHLESLYHYSIDIILSSLESTVWRKEHVQVLVQEELLDFVIMAPWFMPSCSQERACHMVHLLTQVQNLQPPSLGTICKANIAKLKVGLIGKMDTIKSLPQIYSDLL